MKDEESERGVKMECSSQLAVLVDESGDNDTSRRRCYVLVTSTRLTESHGELSTKHFEGAIASAIAGSDFDKG